MTYCLLERPISASIALTPVAVGEFGTWRLRQPEALRRWVDAVGFTAKPGSICLLPSAKQALAGVIVGINDNDDLWALAGLPAQLPDGAYHIDADWNRERLALATLGWALGAYQFPRYRETKPYAAELVIPTGCNAKTTIEQVTSISLVRNLINTPAADMMPAQIAEIILALGETFAAEVTQIVGDDLLKQNYPVIHAVGRASVHAPRLLDLRWGDPAHPKLTLVGKGVCFDSGGLDLKSANNMRLMKKDMGGAAHAIGLARMVMVENLPVRLRLLVPAVENAVSGNAFRPGDILRSRKGLSIEIDNTDAEGRLILCDALTEGSSEQPDLMLDYATLTGAARVALGTDVPAFFANSDAVADDLAEAAKKTRDPIWRLPLHRPYRELLDSRIADIVNSASAPYGGAITAALFLQEFVPPQTPWAHFDLMAWNTRSRPGRPEGGEAMGLRAVYDYLQQRFIS